LQTESLPLTERERKEWKRRILKRYLRNFLCWPFPKEQQDSLAKHFRDNKSKVTVLITPTEEVMKQAGACFLLSFGRELSWTSMSSHELIKAFVEDRMVLAGLFDFDLVIIYHGFDTFPNKIMAESVTQVAFSRSARNLKTLILMKEPDPKIQYPFITIESSSVRPLPARPKTSIQNPSGVVGKTPKGAIT
jgi:hypothetical protein